MARLTTLLLSSILLISTTTALPSRYHSLPFTSPAPIQLSYPTSPSSLLPRQSGEWPPAVDADFPDPCLVQTGGHYYAFATSGNGKNVQIASADDPFGKWTLWESDALPDAGWTSGKDYWAPDVSQLDDGTWVMYFSGQVPAGKHCIGVARANQVEGPYKMDEKPLVCGLDDGGSIDPSAFERDGKRYVTWKVDGIRIGIDPTPLMVQRVNADATALIDEPMLLINRNADEGPLIEAPNLINLPSGGVALFYSSHYFNTDEYDVRFATAESLSGPWTRRGQLLKTPDFGLKGPGGWQSAKDGKIAAFHSWCRSGVRCMYVTRYTFN
ncbi:Fc.00g051900.m01.CDS01 [Cosmosporella sp. VM-42]